MEMEQTKTPKLRFRQDDGTEFPIWESITLETEGNFYNGLSGKTKDDFDHGDAKFIPYIAVYNGTFLNDEILKPVDVHSNERQNKIHNGDLLFTQSSETLEEVGMAAVWMSPSTPYLNSFCFGFRLNKQSHISPEFMGHLMRSPYARRLISTQGQGISRFNISASRLGKIHFMSPAAKEQKKIANFFTAFDCRIALADKKLATLQVIKKGMLQKIFSQETRFRNDDGNEFPSWKTSSIGEISTKQKGNTLSKEDIADDGIIPCILYGQLYTTYGPVARKIYSRTNTLCKGMMLSEADDVVVPVSGETALDISTATCIKDANVAIGGDLLILKSDALLGEFLSYSLNYPLRTTIARYAQGASIVHMNVDSLMKVKITYPCMAEQKKIVSFFSTMDYAIAAAKKKADTLRTIKKGLLQKMFV